MSSFEISISSSMYSSYSVEQWPLMPRSQGNTDISQAFEMLALNKSYSSDTALMYNILYVGYTDYIHTHVSHMVLP